MLKEQAISLLTQVKELILGSESWLDSTHQPIEEAFGMAIEAIKSTQINASNTLNALDTIYRQAAIDLLDNQIEQCDKALGSFDISREDEYAVKVERASLTAYKKQLEYLPSAQPEPEPVGCSGCRYERFGNRVCDVCSKFYADRYEAERRSDE